MRTSIRIVFFLLTVFIMAACSGDSNGMGSDGDNEIITPPGTMSASFNGATWTSISVAASTTTSGTTYVGVGVAGVSGSFDGVALAVADLTGISEKVYTFPNSVNNTLVLGISSTTDPAAEATFDPTRSTATVEITSFDLINGVVSGTFSGNLYKTIDGSLVELRNGVFNQIPLTGIPKNTDVKTMLLDLETNLK
ncbi:MAG: DUF6252 family protein [Calditrichia bacterium]